MMINKINLHNRATIINYNKIENLHKNISLKTNKGSILSHKNYKRRT